MLDSHITDLNRFGEEYNRLANMMLGAHWDFDFGDEIILGENASVDNKMLRWASADMTQWWCRGSCPCLRPRWIFWKNL